MLGIIYRHPVYDKDSIEKFIESIENVHRKIISQKPYFFVMGDINIYLLKIEKNKNSRNYANSLISSSCKCLISIPTRVNINSATLLDHAYTSLLKNILLSGVLVTDISDHYPIFSLISNAGKNYKTEKHITIRDFTAFSKDESNKTLQEALNKNVVSTMFINEQTKIFLNTFSNTVDKLAPFRKMTQKEKRLKRKPWSMREILKLIKIKNKMFKNLHSHILINNPNDLVNDVNQRYKTYRNALNRLISNAKRYYYNKILIENRSNPKKIWQTINILHNSQKLKNQVEITKLQTLYGTVTSPITIAETLNKFFVNIGPQMASNMPDVEVDATTTVNQQSHQSRTFFFSPATPPEIERSINQLKTNKACRSVDAFHQVCKYKE